jgi:hypothetical protein
LVYGVVLEKTLNAFFPAVSKRISLERKGRRETERFRRRECLAFALAETKQKNAAAGEDQGFSDRCGVRLAGFLQGLWPRFSR